jgi:hypothetical protein
MVNNNEIKEMGFEEKPLFSVYMEEEGEETIARVLINSDFLMGLGLTKEQGFNILKRLEKTDFIPEIIKNTNKLVKCINEELNKNE